MSDEEVTNALEDLKLKILTSSFKERRQVIQNVINILSNPGITETIICDICEAISITLHRYRDGKSQYLIRQLIIALTKKYPHITTKCMIAICAELAAQFKNIVVTDNVSHSCLCIFQWCALVLQHGWVNSNEVIIHDIFQIIEAQAVLLTLIMISENKKKCKKAVFVINSLWTSIPDTETLYLITLKSSVQTQHIVVFEAVLAKRLSSNDNFSKTRHLEWFIEAFLKTFLSCKTSPLPAIVKACYPLLSEINLEQFKNMVLPALQKAMLRNPEVITETVGLVVWGVNIDLSSCAMDLGNSLITNLHSKDQKTRTESGISTKYLAAKISDAEIIAKLLQRLFSVYHGSDGKLTDMEQKRGVLQGAGNFSFNAVPPEDFPGLIDKVASHFMKVLKTEVNEANLCFTLEMLSLWATKLNSNVPNTLIGTFENGMKLKSSTSLVRISYVRCMLSTFKSTNISQANLLITGLLELVEGAVSQPLQPLSVSAGLCASLLLINLSSTLESQNAISNMWNVVLDMDKRIFISEKFLQISNESNLPYVTEMCEKLLLGCLTKLNNKTEPIFKALLYCAVYPSTLVRRKCLQIIKRIVDGESGIKVAVALLKQLEEFLEGERINFVKSGEHANGIKPNTVVEYITTLCSSTCQISEYIQQLLIAALIPSHYSLLKDPAPHLWLKIVKHFKCNPKELVAQCTDELQGLLIDRYKASKTYENALATVLSLNPDIFLPDVINKAKTYLEDPRIYNISKDDYLTFLTPEDQLYNKSVIPDDENIGDMYFKREAKAYGNKEQLEEEQLRRELEEKKKKEGKVRSPSYTAKQLEIIKNQKIKEKDIKNRLRELNDHIVKCVSIIDAAAEGCPLNLSLHYKDLLQVILKAMHSYLAAPHLKQTFINLRRTVFPPDVTTLGEMIAIVTLRLSKPFCDLDPHWEEEQLDYAMARMIELIHKHTVINELKNGHFTAPAFSYTFPLLEHSLRSSDGTEHEKLMLDGLQIISEQAKLRGKEESDELDVFNPKYLPTRQIFILLFDIIRSSADKVLLKSRACLLDVAYALSGQKGCASASLEEIDVLLTALQDSCVAARDSSLRALKIIVRCLPNVNVDYEYAHKLYKRIWIARFDRLDENREMASNLFKIAGMEFPPSRSSELIIDIEHPVGSVQSAAAQALAAVVQEDLDQVKPILKLLLELYSDRLKMIPAKLDEFNRKVEEAIDPWSPRRGVALAIAELANLIPPEQMGEMMHFFVFSSLNDRNETVRTEMLNAALKAIDFHGKETVGVLWPIFDNFMGKASKSAQFDAVKEAIVVLMGSLSKHLSKGDERIKSIVSRLIQALSTPSQTIQESIANCLPPLVPSIENEAIGYVNKLLHQLLKGDKYSERKGASYGLAALVKGMGISALKRQDIITKLTAGIQDKKNYKHREGALFGLEMLVQMLDNLFEPYIVPFLPHLLQCFDDSNSSVRIAANSTARAIMMKLSAHGVKLVLPSLLDALQNTSWRTKTGSVELLGTMAYCAPKQLSSCLPAIVPKLTDLLSDSHMKVQEAVAASLKIIGSVIRNPEIQAIVPTLLRALQDPSSKTSICLRTLLDTRFVHPIDAPSLALIMPAVQRAFVDRATETRKMAAQIIGNMYSLTDQKDLQPYLPKIISGLKTCLLDPVPEVRSISARALGTMVKGLDESGFEDLLQWLKQTVTSETNSVDRSGGAQGLSEVIGGLGVEQLHNFMPEIISTTERTDVASHVKDGYIMMFIYMPVVFTDEFIPYISQVINPILKGLADENDYVRDTAFRAGESIINIYADSANLMLLPELEKGLFDENWRIRYSSVQLLGEFLYKIAGVSGKINTETSNDDDNFGTEQSHSAIIKSLGTERRNRVLAELYMGRSDVAGMVSQTALHVWKVVVPDTLRTLREILRALINLLLKCLVSKSRDRRQISARTLGDLTRKLGESVLPNVLPILQQRLQSTEADLRQGVCVGLSEILAVASKEAVLPFVNLLINIVEKALCDTLPEVRQAVAKTFDRLHSIVGLRSLDCILQYLLNRMNDDNLAVVERIIDGLKQVIATNPPAVLPFLIPELVAPPTNTRALATLASVAGQSLNRYLPRILPVLQSTLANSKNTPEEAVQLEHCQAFVLSVVDEMGVGIIIDTMLDNMRCQNRKERWAASTLLRCLCGNPKAQFLTSIPQLIGGLIYFCSETDEDLLKTTWDSLHSVTKSLERMQQAVYVPNVREAVRSAALSMKNPYDVLPGFCLSKGVAHILPIFTEAILRGDENQKEEAALGLMELINVTSASALQPSIFAITGPVIRILGDRYSVNVKSAFLETLSLLLTKVGPELKPFSQQLQFTFVEALNDPSRIVRLKSAAALTHLAVIHPRADPLFTEIHALVKNNKDSTIKETTLQALRKIISSAGDRMSDKVKKDIYTTLTSDLGHTDESIRKCTAGCLGAICKYLLPDLLDKALSENILNNNSNASAILKEGEGSALTVALKEAPEKLWDEKYRNKLTQTLLGDLQSPTINIKQSAIRSCGYLLEYMLKNQNPIPDNVLISFFGIMNNATDEIKQLLATVCLYLSKKIPEENMSAEFLRFLLPALVNGTKEKNNCMKTNSELALITVLRLKEGDVILQKYTSNLDAGAREALSEVVNNVLKKVLNQPEGKDEDIDDTLLK